MRTWSTDFLLREGSSREEIGKWMKNKFIPWRRRRRLLQVVTGTFPCAKSLSSSVSASTYVLGVLAERLGRDEDREAAQPANVELMSC
jgi:hypothetical protein